MYMPRSENLGLKGGVPSMGLLGGMDPDAKRAPTTTDRVPL